MININEDKTRDWKIGQIWIELISFEPTLDMSIAGRFGYWCDLHHVKVGILRPLVFKFTREVREILREIDELANEQF